MKIFFDVDGVLIDGWHARPERRKPWDATLEEDLGVDKDRFQQLFFQKRADGRPSLMEECLTGARGLKAALAEILPLVGHRGSVDEFITYWFRKDSNINRDVLDIVSSLSNKPGIELYIATGQEHLRADFLWQQLDFQRYFRDIFYSAKVGYLKKDPAFFKAVNRALKIDTREKPLFFDDQPEIVNLAKQAGWDAVVYETIDDVRNHPRIVPGSGLINGN
ncbi:MAG: HAD-IA family hydrolase [Pseudomonadota bacterium]